MISLYFLFGDYPYGANLYSFGLVPNWSCSILPRHTSLRRYSWMICGCCWATITLTIHPHSETLLQAISYVLCKMFIRVAVQCLILPWEGFLCLSWLNVVCVLACSWSFPCGPWSTPWYICLVVLVAESWEGRQQLTVLALYTPGHIITTESLPIYGVTEGLGAGEL